MAPVFHKRQVTLHKPDFAMTVPFDFEKFSHSSELEAMVLRKTERRWCWFEEASKEDKEARTRLGTLRNLPYEIRQQIFKIVLKDYYEDYDRQIKEEELSCSGVEYHDLGFLNTWRLEYELQSCRCGQSQGPENCGVFDLGSYRRGNQDTEIVPLSLRFASSSIKLEFDRVFLASNTFKFKCPASLGRFLDQLSPYQQRQLKSFTLGIFGYCSCCPDPVKFCKEWMAVCYRLPPGLKSVEFGFSACCEKLRGTRGMRGGLKAFWGENRRLRQLCKAKAIGLAATVVVVLSKQVWRASSGAKVLISGPEELCEEDCNDLHVVLHELEPWRTERHDWKDGGIQFGVTGGLRDEDLCNRCVAHHWWDTFVHG